MCTNLLRILIIISFKNKTEWMEEIVDELTKVVILKGVVVYCGADATLLQEICTPIFAAKSETTKKSKKNGYDGKTYRLVTYPHPKSEDQTNESSKKC